MTWRKVKDMISVLFGYPPTGCPCTEAERRSRVLQAEERQRDLERRVYILEGQTLPEQIYHRRDPQEH